VLGNHGFGISAQKEGIDLLLGSFHKRFGSYVSYFACSKELKRELFEKIPSLHKERYIPPLYLGMINASIKLIPSMKNERKKLFQLKQILQTTIRKVFLTTNESKAPFVPISLSSPFELKNFKFHLADHACIPGTSPSSLLFFPNLSLTEKEIANLFLTLSSYKDNLQAEAL
jgi:7-keto-8-aminopelargonate synthetase-like enzyme